MMQWIYGTWINNPQVKLYWLVCWYSFQVLKTFIWRTGIAREEDKMSRLQQLGLLLHKNWIVQKRKVCVTVFEILMPLAFGLLLLVIRNLIDTDSFPNGKIFAEVGAPFNFKNASKTEILYSPNDANLQAIMNSVKTDIDAQYPGFITACKCNLS